MESRKGKTCVLLLWADYHNLNQSARAIINPTDDQVEAHLNASYLNEVVWVDDPQRIAQAFDDLCRADWTPNQDAEDRDINASIAHRARAILNDVSASNLL